MRLLTAIGASSTRSMTMSPQVVSRVMVWSASSSIVIGKGPSYRVLVTSGTSSGVSPQGPTVTSGSCGSSGAAKGSSSGSTSGAGAPSSASSDPSSGAMRDRPISTAIARMILRFRAVRRSKRDDEGEPPEVRDATEDLRAGGRRNRSGYPSTPTGEPPAVQVPVPAQVGLLVRPGHHVPLPGSQGPLAGRAQVGTPGAEARHTPHGVARQLRQRRVDRVVLVDHLSC